MKGFLLSSPSVLAAALFLAGYPAAVAGVSPVSLRYIFAPGQTNAYSLQIEAQNEAGREAITGTYVVSSRSVSSNLIGVTLRGQLHPKPLGGMPPMMGYRPGSYMPLSAYTYGYPGQEKELIIDERGQIVRQAGDQPLPVPLGQLAASLLQPFPAEATAGWETEEEVFVLDEPLLQGPAPAFLTQQGGWGGFSGYYPGRSPQGVLAARQKVKINLADVTPETVTLQKTISLDSRMLTRSEPRVSAVGNGRIEFDRARGLPKRVELECKTLSVTENLSRRSVISLRWQLLEGEEREKALTPPSPEPTSRKQVVLSPEELAKLQDQLTSAEPGARAMAAHKLSNSRLTNAMPALVARMASLVSDPDDTVRGAALTFLANNGSKDHVPLLIKGLNGSDATVRAAIAKGLGRLKDPRAIEPLVNLLATGPSDQRYYHPSHESAAAEALAHIGPAAEPAVLGLLKEKNTDTRIQACNILKQIGTKKSLSSLKDLTVNPSKELSEAAAEACRAIQGREAS